MDLESYGILGWFILAIIIIILEILIIFMAVGYVISNVLGINGFWWWILTIACFLLINGLIGGLKK